jgi:hypothetical protein
LLHAGSSYIAGFLLKKYLDRSCSTCRQYFLTQECTDSHSFIVLKDLGNHLLYSSKTFIDIIDLVKKEVLSAFISHINEYRIFDVIKSNINVDMGEICPNHTNIADNIIFGTIFIFVKHIIMILNRKMHLKDLRSYPPLDRYLKNYALLIINGRRSVRLVKFYMGMLVVNICINRYGLHIMIIKFWTSFFCCIKKIL